MRVTCYLCSKALDMHIAVALLRISEGLDYSAVMGDVDDQKKNAPASIPGNQSFSQLSQGLQRARDILLHIWCNER